MILKPEQVIPFLYYVYITAITPGPANLCSLGTAIQYGRKVAMRQWLGLLIGFVIVSTSSALVCYFLGTALNDKVKYLSFIGAAYLVYLAIHMLRSSYTDDPEKVKKPGFVRGLLVQLTNVKVMISCITAISTFILPNTREFWPIFITGLLLPLTGPIANLVWLFTGAALQKFFVNHTKLVNIVMAVSLILCAVSLIIFK